MEMQSQNTKPDPTIPKDNKLSLDDYHHFILSNKQIDLTLRKLLQIIGMHGFVRDKRFKKDGMIEAIKSICLMEPWRSTRDDANVSSDAVIMTLEEAISDLKQLNWQECCVTSIQTVNSLNEGPPLAGSEMMKSARKRPRRQGGAGDRSLKLGGGSGGSRSACSSVELESPVAGVCAEDEECVQRMRRMSDVMMNYGLVLDTAGAPLAGSEPKSAGKRPRRQAGKGGAGVRSLRLGGGSGGSRSVCSSVDGVCAEEDE